MGAERMMIEQRKPVAVAAALAALCTIIVIVRVFESNEATTPDAGSSDASTIEQSQPAREQAATKSPVAEAPPAPVLGRRVEMLDQVVRDRHAARPSALADTPPQALPQFAQPPVTPPARPVQPRPDLSSNPGANHRPVDRGPRDVVKLKPQKLKPQKPKASKAQLDIRKQALEAELFGLQVALGSKNQKDSAKQTP